MGKLKEIVLIGFAVVGFISVLSGFTQKENDGTPESHAWTMILNNGIDGNSIQAFAINKITGEVRKYDTSYEKIYTNNGKVNERYGQYKVATPAN